MPFARPLVARFCLRRYGFPDAGRSSKLGTRSVGALYRPIRAANGYYAGFRSEFSLLSAADITRARDVDDHAMSFATVAKYAARGHDIHDDRTNHDGHGRSGFD